MFNFSGSEIVFLLILGLVVLGPEKLPPALRKLGQLYGQFKRITGDAQSEFKGAFAEPIRDMQKAANEYKSVFTDASKQVESEYVQTTSLFKDSASKEKTEPAIEPQFIPYEAAPSPIDELSLEPTIIEYDVKEDK
jgi:sec-independent protein translocase protein TatB